MRASCEAAQEKVLSGDLSAQDTVATIRRDCDPGDVFEVRYDHVIRRICDFSKSIYRVDSGMTICVLKPP
jgi:hypothetical protein